MPSAAARVAEATENPFCRIQPWPQHLMPWGEKIAERTFTGVLSSCEVALPGQNTISVQGAITLVTSRRDAAATDCC